MRHAILSDVHANVSALKAVLTDAQDAGAERVVCLGDVLGYGPDPVAALELIHDRAHVCLCGNHDAAVCGILPVDDFTPVAARAVAGHRERLSAGALRWLKTLPYTCEGPGFACAHGDFSDPHAFNYILDPEDAVPSWDVRAEQLLFVGHTHQPGVYVLGQSGIPHRLDAEDFVLEDGKRYIVNVGSTGYPRSGACRSFYCIFDDRTRAVYFRSLPFDLEGYRRKMNGLGLDEAPWLAARAKDRLRPAVRASADFAKVAPRKNVKKSPAVRQAVPVIPAPTEEAPRPGIVPALIAGAALVVFGGVFCTYTLVKSMPDPAEKKTVAAVKVAEAPSGEPKADAIAFDTEHPVMLSGDWIAYLEVPSRQKVRIVTNSKKNVTAFRIENNGAGWVRFVRTRSFFDRPSSISTKIENLTRPLPGRKSAFAFNARLSFFDENGKSLGVSPVWSGKISAKKEVPVPDGAVSAEFRIDCRSSGTHELAVPHFSSGETETLKKSKENK